MAKKFILVALALLLLLCACTPDIVPSEPPTAATDSAPTLPTETEETTAPTEAPTLPTETLPLHSTLYIDGLAVEDVIRYFNEVVLDAEFVNAGNASLVQKWEEPIRYQINGTPTDEDLQMLSNFCQWLNTVDGFPGIAPESEDKDTNLRIYFSTEENMVTLLGDNFWGLDGGVTFWYLNNAIYDATICYRTDIPQIVRNSVILEEIYNGLGPVQDTDLRTDSIIYSGYSEPQSLTAIDELLLKLLYSPEIECGMNAAECEEVIRRLYY